VGGRGERVEEEVEEEGRRCEKAWQREKRQKSRMGCTSEMLRLRLPRNIPSRITEDTKGKAGFEGCHATH
jgi:hypothetical protein